MSSGNLNRECADFTIHLLLQQMKKLYLDLQKTVRCNAHFILSKVTAYYISTGVQFSAKDDFFRHHIHVGCGIPLG